MDWDDLRYVLELSRHHTMTGAAEALGVTRTTVARRVNNLQSQLGVRLFDRTPDGLFPTASGEELAMAAELMEREALSAAAKVLGRDAQLRGALRVSTLDFVFTAFSELFTSFMQRYPTVELTVSTADEEVSLERREADLVVRLNNTPDGNLVGRRIATVQFAVYGSRKLVERIGPDAGLGAYPWIGWDERENARRQWMQQWIDQHAPGAKFVMRLDGSSLALTEALSAGIGVHFLPCFTGDRAPNLVRLSGIEPAFARDLWALTLPELRSTSRVRAFLNHMVDGLREQAASFSGIAPPQG